MYIIIVIVIVIVIVIIIIIIIILAVWNFWMPDAKLGAKAKLALVSLKIKCIFN